MKSTTANISQICEYEWYKWVVFRDFPHQYPADTMILGQYLGPSMDVGSVMTTKILKGNGDFMCRSILRGLTQDKMENPVHIDSWHRFDVAINQKLGLTTVPTDFDDSYITPEFKKIFR